MSVNTKRKNSHLLKFWAAKSDKVALTAGKTAAPVGLTVFRGASENI